MYTEKIPGIDSFIMGDSYSEGYEEICCPYCDNCFSVWGAYELGGWMPLDDSDLICPECEQDTEGGY